MTNLTIRKRSEIHSTPWFLRCTILAETKKCKWKLVCVRVTWFLFKTLRKSSYLSIVNLREHVASFLEFYFSLLLKNIRESADTEEVMADLTASALQAVTIFFITIDSTIPHSNLLQLSGHIGSQLRTCLDGESQASKYASDYREQLGDCFRKQLDLFGIQHFLRLLESLDATALIYVLKAAHETLPNRLKELVNAARSKGSFNKVLETYDSLIRDSNAR